MKTQRKRMGLLAACLLLAVLCCVQVLAVDAIDTSAVSTMDVVFNPEGVKASGVKIDIYKIASVTASGDYVVTGAYATDDIVKLLDAPTSESYSLLATTVAGLIDADGTIKPTKSAVTGTDGVAHFTGLEPGLYFIDGDIYHADGVYYTPHNSVVQVPMPAENGTWSYNVTANIKWEKRTDTQPINLKVLKVWADSSTNYHTTDYVTIELYKNGTLYDAQLLTKDNSWTHTWTDLESGAKWTLKEKGITGYTGTVERSGDCFVITNTPTSTSSDENKKLPQTGLLWWPVPILVIVGFVFIAIGIRSKRRGRMYGAK